MGNTWDAKEVHIWCGGGGGGGDTKWEQVKKINEWVEQKTGLRCPQRDTKDKTLRTKYRGECTK